jgi:hypothetical protein
VALAAIHSGTPVRKKSEFLQGASVTITKGNSRVRDLMRHDCEPVRL